MQIHIDDYEKYIFIIEMSKSEYPKQYADIQKYFAAVDARPKNALALKKWHNVIDKRDNMGWIQLEGLWKTRKR